MKYSTGHGPVPVPTSSRVGGCLSCLVTLMAADFGRVTCLMLNRDARGVLTGTLVEYLTGGSPGAHLELFLPLFMDLLKASSSLAAIYIGYTYLPGLPRTPPIIQHGIDSLPMLP
jgi:hypothetical protein